MSISIIIFIHLSFVHVYAILFAAAMKGSKGENVTSVSQITHSFIQCLVSFFSFPWQLFAEMVVSMAVVLNLETVSELLCEMELVFDHCNWSPVMVFCSIRCIPGYQGNLCDQRELAS